MTPRIRDLLDEIRRLCIDSEEARLETARLLAELIARHDQFKRYTEQFVIDEQPG